MIEINELEGYLNGLYEMCNTMQTEYKNLHKRSKRHNMETAENYYQRWKSKLLSEISRMEQWIIDNGQWKMNNNGKC